MSRRISSPALVGRERELETLDALLAQAREGVPSLCVVAGEAGVGKTRLGREVEAHARQAGMRCLRGQCLALAGGEFPFAPLLGILEPLSGVVAGLEPGARRRLDALLGLAAPEAGAPLAAVRAHPTLFEVLRRAAAEQPTAILVEDLHWADESTRDFLRHLAHGLRDERLLVVATFRTDELSPGHPGRALVAELIRSERVLCLELERLTREQTAQQLAAIAGSPVGEAALDAVHDRAQGNPFLAEELWAARSAPGRGLPATLGDALLARVRALPADVQDLLRLLAVFGRPVGDELVAAAAHDAAQAGALLRRAVSEHVLVASAGGWQLGFRHALVREALYDELAPGEREPLHRAVADALGRPGGGGSAAELAYHRLAAGQPGAALIESARAGSEDVRRAAYPEALAHFERALELWEAVTPPPAALDRLDLYRDAAEAARLTGEYERAVALCREALEGMDVVAEPVRAAGFFERLSRYQSWDAERSLEALESALALLDAAPSAERARVLTGQSLQLGMRGRWSEAGARAAQALEVAVAAGARAEECSARAELGLALAFAGAPADGERELRRALALAEALAAPEEVARGFTYLAELERLRGRTAAALEAMLAGQERAAALGVWASWGAFMAVLSADDLLALGRWRELDDLLEATASVNAGRAGAVMWPLVAGQLATARGRLADALGLLERAAASALRGVTPELIPHVGAALAELHRRRGALPAAQDRLEVTRGLIGDHEDTLNTPPLYCVGVRVELDVAETAERAGDRRAAVAARERAEALAERLQALLARGPAAPPKALACLAQVRAELAPEETAAAGWERTAAAWEALSDPHRAANARLRYAQALLGERGRRPQAAGALRLAHRQAQALGAEALRRDAEALARRARLDLTAPEPAARPAAPGLTRREAEVLGLVADGLTNRQIAERLFITPKTAGLHVSHILAKLNVDSRVKAAAAVHRGHLEDSRHAPHHPHEVRSAVHARSPEP